MCVLSYLLIVCVSNKLDSLETYVEYVGQVPLMFY